MFFFIVGKIVIIIGLVNGVGFVVVWEFVDCGVNVVMVDMDDE